MSARRNGKILTRETPVKYCLFSWDELSDDLLWTFEKRAGADSYSCLQGTREAVLEEFAAWVRAAPGMDVRILREGGHNRMARRFLLAERIGGARTTSVAVRSAESDELQMAAVVRHDPPLLIAGTVDLEFTARMIVSEGEGLCSRRCSILVGGGTPLRAGTVLSRIRTEHVADEQAIKVACLTQAAFVGSAISGDPDSDRQLADQIEYRYYPTPRGGVANGGVLLNVADNFPPPPGQHYGAIVLRGAAEARFEHLVFDDTVDTADERERVAASLFQNAGVFVRMPAAGAR